LGVHDYYGHNIDGYRTNLENVRFVVPKMLQLFSERNIRATWATVGAVALSTWDEYFTFSPSPPAYENNNLAIDPFYAEIDPDGTLHFAPDLVNCVVNTPGQELGSHSFSHIFFRENGVTSEDFIADESVVRSVFNDLFKINPISLVFPRNQIAFQSFLSDCGIHIWRGNENAWYFESKKEEHNLNFARCFRLYESINPWIKRSLPLDNNICYSSMFIRFNLPEVLWKLHLKRINNEINNLSGDEILHIWWHPHNLGSNMDERFQRLERILDLIVHRCSNGSVNSSNMSDIILS
jgi:hypothetical protein